MPMTQNEQMNGPPTSWENCIERFTKYMNDVKPNAGYKKVFTAVLGVLKVNKDKPFIDLNDAFATYQYHCDACKILFKLPTTPHYTTSPQRYQIQYR